MPAVESYSDDRLLDALFKAVYAEIKRLDQLRSSDQLATTTALTAAEKAVAAALAASDKAVEKSETAQKGVNEGQNEFRGTLRDQAATFMPRAETESLVRELRGLIGSQSAELGDLRSRIDVGPPSLTAIQARSDADVGRRQGAADTQKLVFALIGAAVAALPLLAIYLANAGN
jgi:hypothetical protein